jgi:hypothetical protein
MRYMLLGERAITAFLLERNRMQENYVNQNKTDWQSEDTGTSVSSYVETDDTEIPLEEAIREQIVDFWNDQLDAALTASGVYISLPGMCAALGLHSQPQVRRIKGTTSLMKGLRRIRVQTKGGRQPVNFLRVDKVALWLGGIETTRMKQDTDTQRFMREKIERYQEELAPVATQVFLRVLNEDNLPAPQVLAHPIETQENPLAVMSRQLTDLSDAVPSIQQAVAALLEAASTQTIRLERLLEISSSQDAKIQALLDVVSSQALDLSEAIDLLTRYLQSQENLAERLERVDERTKRLSPEHAQTIQHAVSHIVAAIQKKNPSISNQIAHRTVYGRLKARFRPATSYREIDDDRFEEAMEFLRKEYRSILRDGPQQPQLF